MCSVMVHAQRKPKIKGSRVVTEVKQALAPFNTIVLSDDLDIQIKKASEEGYQLKIDDNLIDVLKFKVTDDGVLEISSFYSITSSKKLEITIFYKELTAITVEAGSMEMNDIIVSDHFTTKVSGDARLQLKVRAALVDAYLDDSSKSDFNIDADSLHISMKGKADAALYMVAEAASVEMDRNAKADVEGTANDITVALGSNANFSGTRLEASNMLLDIQGSSDAYINCIQHFELLARHNAKAYLSGGAKITITEFANSALLRKQDN